MIFIFAVAIGNALKAEYKFLKPILREAEKNAKLNRSYLPLQLLEDTIQLNYPENKLSVMASKIDFIRKFSRQDIYKRCYVDRLQMPEDQEIMDNFDKAILICDDCL